MAAFLEYLEKKLISRAFHWRGLDAHDQVRVRDFVLTRWSESAEPYGLSVHHFDGGIELRAAEIEKGRAIREVSRDMGSDAVIAYLGDDQTDEDAFRAIRDHGLAVLVRGELRETDADIWLSPPDEMLAFLDGWMEALGVE